MPLVVIGSGLSCHEDREVREEREGREGRKGREGREGGEGGSWGEHHASLARKTLAFHTRTRTRRRSKVESSRGARHTRTWRASRSMHMHSEGGIDKACFPYRGLVSAVNHAAPLLRNLTALVKHTAPRRPCKL